MEWERRKRRQANRKKMLAEALREVEAEEKQVEAKLLRKHADNPRRLDESPSEQETLNAKQLPVAPSDNVNTFQASSYASPKSNGKRTAGWSEASDRGTSSCRPPRSVEIDTSKSSPVSTVAASQSPPMIKRNYDSEDDVDLVAFAQEEEARHAQAAQEMASAPRSPAVAGPLYASGHQDQDKLSTGIHRKMRSESSGVCSDKEGQNDSFRPPCSHRGSTGSNTSRTARNPLALAKAFESPAVARTSISHGDDDKLWTDDDEEEGRCEVAGVQAESGATERGPIRSSEKEEGHESGSGRRLRVDQTTTLVESGSESEEDEQEIPYFDNPSFFTPGLGPLSLGHADADEQCEVPSTINRYLRDFQREGVSFVYNCVASGRGAVLGDDMGLGKTIQVIALLAALLHKTGTAADKKELRRRERRIAERRRLRLQDIENGRVPPRTTDLQAEVGLPSWWPIIIIVPPTLAENWQDEFGTWGSFALSTYAATARDRNAELEKLQEGQSEVLICSRSFFAQENALVCLQKIPWKLVIIDEFHDQFKNEQGKLSKNLRLLKESAACPVLGLTGTLMQNNHKELWNLIDLVEESFLGSWNSFSEIFGEPIKTSGARDADQAAKRKGREKKLELNDMLSKLYISRKKENVLADILPTKNEHIIFCPLSKLQKTLYRHILSLPDFVLVSKATGPCDCGVNQKFFQEYQSKRTKDEKIAYQRANKRDLMRRGDCHYKIPRSGGRIDPRAVLWRAQHKGDKECDNCPFCISFAALSILYKLSSHVSLLQVREESSATTEAVTPLDKAKVFLPEDILAELPGESRFRSNNVMGDRHFELSGKLKVLAEILERIRNERGRVLLFSASTQMLDIIEEFCRLKYDKYLRIDGSKSQGERNAAVEKFKKDAEYFVFLLSTKAMATGLNLQEANNVIIFDVEWNPAYDQQAQDRAYRIGQNQDVNVFRLVARGTVEELKYLRQVYKTQLKEETIIEAGNGLVTSDIRRFRGVEGHKDRKGELFGLANLLKFKDGTFMTYGRTKTRYRGVAVHSTGDMVASIMNASVEDLAALTDDSGFEGGSTPNHANKRQEEYGVGDPPDDDGDLGGESQVNVGICDDFQSPTVDSICDEGPAVELTDTGRDQGRVKAEDARAFHHTDTDHTEDAMERSTAGNRKRADDVIESSGSVRRHYAAHAPMHSGELREYATDATPSAGAYRPRNYTIFGVSKDRIRKGRDCHGDLGGPTTPPQKRRKEK